LPHTSPVIVQALADHQPRRGSLLARPCRHRSTVATRGPQPALAAMCRQRCAGRMTLRQWPCPLLSVAVSHGGEIDHAGLNESAIARPAASKLGSRQARRRRPRAASEHHYRRKRRTPACPAASKLGPQRTRRGRPRSARKHHLRRERRTRARPATSESGSRQARRRRPRPSRQHHHRRKRRNPACSGPYEF
jgi:hypothetical protein